MAPLSKVLNKLLPFATPGTPLLQDLIHLAVLCTLLYFAPQIQQRLQRNRALDHHHGQIIGANELDVETNDAAGANGARAIDEDNRHHEHEDEANPEPLHALGNDNRPEDVQHARNLETARQGNVGTKKAKSLARKDQRRAYHEFMRSQGDAQRDQDAEGASEREAALTAERERRKAVEKDLEARKASEREAKRQRHQAQREAQSRRVEFVLSTVKQELNECRKCDLFKIAKMAGDDVDEDWVEKVLQSSGLLGTSHDVATMITSTGWVVRVTAQDMMRLYQAAIDSDLGDADGMISNDDLAVLLQSQLEGQ